MQGFLLGQLSVVILFGAFIKFFIFGDASSVEATATARRQQSLAHKRSYPSLAAGAEQAGRKKQQSLLRKALPLTTAAILEKTYYNVNSHLPESVDWFNVLFAQTIAQFRSDAQHDNAILGSLNTIFKGIHKPDFLDDIKITELSLGEDFPIFSNCRVIPVHEEGDGIKPHGRVEGGRLQARMDVDLNDSITLGVETKLVLNYPRPRVAVLPVALTVSVVRFTGTVGLCILPLQLQLIPLQLSISFIPSSPTAPSPTTLAFSFSDDYRLELSTRSLVGSRSRLQDVPKIAQIIEARLHAWFDERCVEPRFQQIVLPSLWPRKQNTRGGEEDPMDYPHGSTDPVNYRAEADEANQTETEQMPATSTEYLRQRRRPDISQFSMPGGMPGLAATDDRMP